NILRALDRRRTMPPALATLLDSPMGSKRVDLGGGLQAVREHDRLWLEHVPVALDGEVRWGDWRIRSSLPGLRVRGWRPGDRLAGRSKKVQDVFVDAKIPRSDREGWPLVVRILKDLDINIEGRDVLVVEDIIDSGLTLSYLVRNLESRAPASLEVCALLTKPERREIDVDVRYVGFEIPNRFVIGYGLDFAERYRNLPYVGVLHDDLMPEGV